MAKIKTKSQIKSCLIGGILNVIDTLILAIPVYFGNIFCYDDSMNKYLKTKPLEAILWLFSTIIIVSAIVYKIYALNWPGVLISLILSLVLWLALIKLISRDPIQSRKEKLSLKSLQLKDWLLFGVYIALNLWSFYALWHSRSDAALVSPWTVVPGYFFVLYFLATAVLITLIRRARSNQSLYTINFILIAGHYLLSVMIAVIVYKIGYGYDPFIHQATMDLIDKQGTVSPKPFYYLGQYGLLITIHKLTGLSLVWLDKLLVPVLATIFLPLALNNFVNKYFANKDYKQLLLLIVLIIPFSWFILTTPQNLAFLFLILTGLYGATGHRLTPVLALAACLIHPLAGIPALILSLLLLLYNYKHKINRKLARSAYLLLFLAALLGLPVAFYLSGQSQLTWSLNSFSSFFIALAPHLSLPYKETWLLNLSYFYGQNWQLIVTLLIIGGAITVHRRHARDFRLSAAMLLAIATLGSFFLVSQLSFNLISYEQNDFAQRLLIVVVMLALPAIILALGRLTEKILTQNKFYRLSFLLILSFLISTSLYLSYPRADHYYNSKAYAVSQSDKEAVNWIEGQSNRPYIVLANQQTGAMALRSLGFNRYYQNLYFYPIPTSGPLYQYFLQMVYVRADRQTIEEAMNLAQVDEAYFVLPKYWWAFSKILAEAKLSADSWHKVGDGQIYIFKYSLTKQ